MSDLAGLRSTYVCNKSNMRQATGLVLWVELAPGGHYCSLDSLDWRERHTFDIENPRCGARVGGTDLKNEGREISGTAESCGS